MISPADQRIIQIEVTNACPHKCSNCTRLCGHTPKPFFMEESDFRAAVDSLHGYNGLVGMMGGEPTLHPKFESLVEYLRDRRPPIHHRPERRPIASFNDYRMAYYSEITPTAGLWSSLGDTYYKHFELIQDSFDYQCINDHRNPGRHQGFLIASEELPIPEEQRRRLIDNCWVQTLWSASITPKGAFFCEVAAALDMILDGPGGWPVEPGWWRRKPADFGKQLEWCKLCGAAMPVPLRPANEEIDDVSPGNLKRLEAAGSLKARQGKVAVFDVAGYDPSRYPDRPHAEWYLPKTGNRGRVNPTNRSLYPRRVACVLTCVNYGDYLERTLPFNLRLFEQFVVVTDPADKLTQAVCARHPGVDCVLTDRLRENGDRFNKGKALNDGLRVLRDPDWVLFTDADMILAPRLRSFLDEHVLNPGVLYYSHRVHLTDCDKPLHDLPGILEGAHSTGQKANLDCMPWGFFQLWNVRARALRGRMQPVPEDFPTAEYIDVEFALQWPVHKRVRLPIPYLLNYHLPHGSRMGSNWGGRVTAALGKAGLAEARPREEDGWTVVFSGDRPDLWNTGLAVDATRWGARLPAAVEAVRLRRLDTGETLEAAIRGDLNRDLDGPAGGWQGRTLHRQHAFHLGLMEAFYLDPTDPCRAGRIVVGMRHASHPSNRTLHGGTGFGHALGGAGGQCVAWRGEPIACGLEIAVRPVASEQDVSKAPLSRPEPAQAWRLPYAHRPIPMQLRAVDRDPTSKENDPLRDTALIFEIAEKVEDGMRWGPLTAPRESRMRQVDSSRAPVDAPGSAPMQGQVSSSPPRANGPATPAPRGGSGTEAGSTVCAHQWQPLRESNGTGPSVQCARCGLTQVGVGRGVTSAEVAMRLRTAPSSLLEKGIPQYQRAMERFGLILGGCLKGIGPRRALDVQAGFAYYMPALEARGWAYRALESRPMAMDFLRGALRIEPLAESPGAVPDEERFGLILVRDGLRDSTSPGADFAALARLLAPNGLMAFGGHHAREADEPGPRNVITPETLRIWAANAGLAITRWSEPLDESHAVLLYLQH